MSLRRSAHKPEVLGYAVLDPVQAVAKRGRQALSADQRPRNESRVERLNAEVPPHSEIYSAITDW